jgi:flavin reductase (DIM6/NTAB) family NADH-FMN oxidoreductase RutF
LAIELPASLINGYNTSMAEPTFVQALGKIPSGLFVLTVKKSEAQSALLASWVQQVSFDPPRITVAVHHDRSINRLLSDQTLFVVHILGEDQTGLLQRFAKAPKSEAKLFEGLSTLKGMPGNVILKEAFAYLECRVWQKVNAGDHDLVLADILNGAISGSGGPRVHIRKNGLGY